MRTTFFKKKSFFLAKPCGSSIKHLRLKEAELKGGITIDFDALLVTYHNEKAKPLRGDVVPRLLNFLLANNGRFLSRRQLSESPAWDGVFAELPKHDSRTIQMGLTRLRKLVQFNGCKQKIIRNLPRKGWMIPNEAIISIKCYEQ